MFPLSYKNVIERMKTSTYSNLYDNNTALYNSNYPNNI